LIALVAACEKPVAEADSTGDDSDAEHDNQGELSPIADAPAAPDVNKVVQRPVGKMRRWSSMPTSAEKELHQPRARPGETLQPLGDKLQLAPVGDKPSNQAKPRGRSSSVVGTDGARDRKTIRHLKRAMDFAECTAKGGSSFTRVQSPPVAAVAPVARRSPLGSASSVASRRSPLASASPVARDSPELLSGSRFLGRSRANSLPFVDRADVPALPTLGAAGRGTGAVFAVMQMPSQNQKAIDDEQR